MKGEARIAAAFLIHDDNEFLEVALKSFEMGTDRFVFVSRVPWAGDGGDWQRTVAISEAAGCKVVTGDWSSERDHRKAAYSHLKSLGFTHALIPDGDEVIEPELLISLIEIAHADLADRVYIEWETYWRDPYHVVRPSESFTPCMLINLDRARHVELRQFEGGRALLLNNTYGLVHHLSYAGSDDRIARKISTWSHRNEVVEGWWERVWQGWDRNRRLENLHPTHPESYRFIEHIELPVQLLAAGLKPEAKVLMPVPAQWPTVSIVIPLYGGEKDIQSCLNSLASCFSLLHEVIVVDNGSEDEACNIARRLVKGLPGGRVIELGSNHGFAHGCNRGASESAGEVLLFLNSDTIVSRSGLIRLIESLLSSGSVGAAGPYTNNAGHHQRIQTTYTTEATIDHFADDFAEGQGLDRDVDMLVGFCLAVRKSAWTEVGPFDAAFGIGLFEDNDLSYRLRRKGYRLVVSGRSFIHHAGSKTLRRVVSDPSALLSANRSRFVQKWHLDLETGFANGLSGLVAEPIVFVPENKPERLLEIVSRKAQVADISLCMIVRDEERVLTECLSSAKPFFREIIIVDTGSTDATRSIAESFGARVFDFPWTDSFSEARNESLKHAKGKWICWLDADDTLPLKSGEAIIEAVLAAQEDLAGFVVPVRFVDDGENGGVQVDHVKVFRNLSGIAFEGRIHEQILRSLRTVAGEESKIARLEAFVLHSGYDMSTEGQEKKRERDKKLLELDLAERPNHPFVLFNLGMTAHYTKDHAAAIEWLTRCLQLSETAESHVRKAYALLGVSNEKLGLLKEANETWLTGLRDCPGDPELHFHIARLASDRKDLEVAAENYKAVLNASIAGHYSSVDRGIFGFKTLHNLASVEAMRGDYVSARQWFVKAIESSPEHLPSSFALFDLAREHGDLKTAKAIIHSIQNREGHSESVQKMIDALML